MAKGTIIVTGANGGLGSAIAEKILSTAKYAEYHTIFTVRKVDTATTLQGILQKYSHTPHTHEVIALDLSSLASGRAVAEDINRRVSSKELPPISALILNAGYQEHTTLSFSNDGFDMTFQANYLTHWLLTVKLLQSMDKTSGRIVVVGSWTHDPYDKRNDSMGIYKEEKWKTLFPDTETLAKGKFSIPEDDPTSASGFRRYGAGKLCQIMMIHELQARLDADPGLSNISVLGVDPGGMPTSITRRGNFLYSFILGRLIMPILAPIAVWLWPNGMFRTPAKSAGDILRAAFDVESLGQHPKALYLNGSELGQSSEESRDKTKLLALWRDSVKLTQLKEGETILAEWK